jgi:2-iminobutanoate/2-iminopropanoate deaminase
MERTAINPDTAPPPLGGYSQAVEIQGASRLLFVSGQIPEAVDGTTPTGFDAQCEAVWHNLGQVLAAAGMGYENLVKVTTFLTALEQAGRNGESRRRFLGEIRPALTVVVLATLDSKWLLEIEAVAAA